MNGHLSEVKSYVQTRGIFVVLGRYCNTSHLRCRAVSITVFSFIARGFEGILFQENCKDFGCFLLVSKVYYDINMS